VTVAAALALAGCGAPATPPPAPPAVASTAEPAAQVVLDDLVRAARAGDRRSYDATISTADPSFADRARLLHDNLAALPWAALEVRLEPGRQPVPARLQDLLGADAWRQPARVRWRLVGERATAEHTVWLTFALDRGRPRLAGTAAPEDPDDPEDATRPQPVWWTGPVTTATREGVTVLVGSGQRASTWLDRAVAAAAEVRERVSRGAAAGWDGGLLVEVPATRPAFEAVLGAAPGRYADIAAVALLEGPDGDAALRVVVNPEVVRRLAPLGVAVVLTHETVHVATRSPDSPAPTWAVEGLADQVALAAHPDAADGVAEPLLARVRADGPPDALPGDEAFLAGADDLAVSYAAAWTLCRHSADTWSEQDLQRLYTALDGGQHLDQALPATLGTTEQDLLAGWRAALEQQAGT
jgi:hypothetical protein